jgi:hypothetical protein
LSIFFRRKRASNFPIFVLYLDFEQRSVDIKEQCELIRCGLGIKPPIDGIYDILYMYLYQRLIDCVEQIREVVKTHDIKLVIIDSVGLACGGEGDDVKAVVPYFQALRSLGVTTLSLDHTTTKGNAVCRKSAQHL